MEASMSEESGQRGVIDFDHPYQGRIGNDEVANKYKGKKVGFNGDYKVPKDLQEAIEQAGQEFLKYAEENSIDLVAYGFDINGDGKVGHFEAGSGCAAFALEHGMRLQPGKAKEEIASIFNDGNFVIKKALKGENWRAAEQILGDNWPHQVKKPTNTEAADKAFVSQYKTSGNAGLIRSE
jgi:hypothetical protein